MVSDRNYEMSWTWHILDGGLSSSLRVPLMPDVSPQFSKDGGLTCTTALNGACEFNESLSVSFHRVDPEMTEEIANAKEVMETMKSGILKKALTSLNGLLSHLR